MSIRIIKESLKIEKRKGPKGSYGTNFAEIQIVDDGTRKSLDVYYNPHNSDYGLEIYQGPNYVPPFDSKEKSYSRQYKKFREMPEKYFKLAYFLYNKVPKRN